MAKENSEIKLKRIAIVGPESTGKTTLAKELATYYHTLFVPEMAREYLTGLGRKYEPHDIEAISRLQIKKEEEMSALANTHLFCDTNLLVSRIWLEFVYGYCPDWLEIACSNQKYDLHLLLYPNTIWEPDPLREHPHQRIEIFQKYEKLLTELGLNYKVINDLQQARLAQAIEAINNLK